MGEQFDALTPEVQKHITKLQKTAGLPAGEDALEALSAAWLEKQASFFEQTKQNNMEEVDNFDLDEPRGALILTLSGSLLSIGPLAEGQRRVEYVSIGLREDVPESASDDSAVLVHDIYKGGTVEMDPGPIQKSSPVHAIAVLMDEMPPEEEEELLGEMTLLLTRDFVDINKTILS